MNRRAFLKSLCTLPVASVVGSSILRSTQSVSATVGTGSKITTKGLSHEQLCEIAKDTLRDIPPLEIDWYRIDYHGRGSWVRSKADRTVAAGEALYWNNDGSVTT